jgi:hypothetical protein
VKRVVSYSEGSLKIKDYSGEYKDECVANLAELIPISPTFEDS